MELTAEQVSPLSLQYRKYVTYVTQQARLTYRCIWIVYMYPGHFTAGITY